MSGGGDGGTTKGYGVSSGDGEDVLKFMVAMVAKPYEYAKTH